MHWGGKKKMEVSFHLAYFETQLNYSSQRRLFLTLKYKLFNTEQLVSRFLLIMVLIYKIFTFPRFKGNVYINFTFYLWNISKNEQGNFCFKSHLVIFHIILWDWWQTKHPQAFWILTTDFHVLRLLLGTSWSRGGVTCQSGHYIWTLHVFQDQSHTTGWMRRCYLAVTTSRVTRIPAAPPAHMNQILHFYLMNSF